MDFISPYGSEDEQQPQQNASTIRMIGLDGQVRTVHQGDSESHQIYERQDPPTTTLSQWGGEGRVVIQSMGEQVSNVRQVDDNQQHTPESQALPGTTMSQRGGEGRIVIQPMEGRAQTVYQLDESHYAHEHQGPPVTTTSQRDGEGRDLIQPVGGQMRSVGHVEESHHMNEQQGTMSHEHQGLAGTTMAQRDGEGRVVTQPREGQMRSVHHVDESRRIQEHQGLASATLSQRGGEGRVVTQPREGQMRSVHHVDESRRIQEHQGLASATLLQRGGDGRVVTQSMEGQMRSVHHVQTLPGTKMSQQVGEVHVDGSPHIHEHHSPSGTTMSKRDRENHVMTEPKRNWNGWTESPSDDDEWEESPRPKYESGLSSRGNRPRAGSDPISSTATERRVHSNDDTAIRRSSHRPPMKTPQPRGWASSVGSEWMEAYSRSISKSRDSRQLYWPPILIQKKGGCNRTCKILVSILYVVGLIGCGFFLAIATGAKEVKTEQKAAKLLANNNNVCLQGRIQQRTKVTLFLALEGLTVAAVDGLDDIIETAVRDGYNTATGGCTDACNRWAYLATVESEADIELDNGNPAVYTEVLMFLSQRNCAPGETFASVFPGELDRMRRTLTIQDGTIPNQDLPSPAQAHELWPTVGDGLFEPTAGNGRGRSLTSSGTFFVQEPRKLQQGLDFQNIMAAIEENVMKALERYYDHAGFVGIQEVLIVQPDSDQTLSQIGYTRAAPGFGFARAGKSEKAGGGVIKSTKSPKTASVISTGTSVISATLKANKTGTTKSTKAPKGGKGTKSPSGGKSTKSPKGGKGTKSPSGGKSTKSPKGTKSPSGGKSTKSPKGTKSPSGGKSTKSPKGGKATKSPKVFCSTKAPKSTKVPGATKAPGKGSVRHERRLGGTAVSGGSSFRVGSIQLTDPTAVKFFDNED